ncbi:MAG TPA: hypothetical protein VMD47_07625 [Candidatus Acidoferrales bacterium]|nr:hypothetical protein [Candidatus Acidoferrales bacterium]
MKVPAKPASGSTTKHPHYITANVQGISFTVTQAANPSYSSFVFYALTPQSTYCTGTVSTGLTCTLAVAAAPGSDTFVVDLYDGTEMYAAFVVATGNLTQTILAQTSNDISITTDGVPTAGIIGLANAFPATGSAATIALTIDVTDPDGDVIVGSYDQPVTLSDSDTSGGTSLSSTSLAGSSDTSGVTLSYNGATLTGPATITLTSNSPALASYGLSPTLNTASFSPGSRGVNLAPSVLYFATASAAAQTLTATGADGGTAPFSVSNNCGGIVSVSGSGPSFTVTPVAANTGLSQGYPAYYWTGGSCTLIVSDSEGDQSTIGVIVGN